MKSSIVKDFGWNEFLMLLFLLALTCVGSLGCDGSADPGASLVGGSSGSDATATDDGGGQVGHDDGGPGQVGDGGPGMQPDGAPADPTACDPVKQTGCPNGMACDRTCDSPTGVSCRAVTGGGQQGAACEESGDTSCAAGRTCAATLMCPSSGQCFYVATYCVKICEADADCPTGKRCVGSGRCSWSTRGDTRPLVIKVCN